MNRLIKKVLFYVDAAFYLFAVLVMTALLSLLSCQATEEQPIPDIEQTLESPPFAALTDSIRQFPEDATLRLQRAVSLSQHNLHKFATADYRKAWEILGNEDVALQYISNLLLVNELPRAIDLLREAAQKFPENTEFNRRLGELYTQNGQLEEGLEQYDRIIDKDSTNFEAWFDRGTLLARMKDTAGAIASLETSFALLPINYSGIPLANLYISRKDPRAVEVCNILLAKDSVEVQAEPVFMKGVYYAEVKDYDKALSLFDECIKRDWKMTEAYIEKGIILFEQKKYNEAMKVFTLAGTVSNSDADVYYWLGRCFEATGDRENARANYQRAFALDDTFLEARDGIKRMDG